YIRTYYSLLRSTGDVRVRAFEEAHSFSRSSLHAGAREPAPDLAAFAYSAARLPDCFPEVRRVVLGQSLEQFEQAGLPVRQWETVRARGRRRAMRWSGDGVLAVFITSASDIDDLVPIVTAYQIEWNKMHALAGGGPGGAEDEPGEGGEAEAGEAGGEADRVLARLGLEEEDVARLRAGLGLGWREELATIRRRTCDLSIRLLYGSFSQYQTSAQRWWRSIERRYLASGEWRRPIYFVSSNT